MSDAPGREPALPAQPAVPATESAVPATPTVPADSTVSPVSPVPPAPSAVPATPTSSPGAPGTAVGSLPERALPGRVRKPLRGWRVLVPRGGPWGDGVAAELRARGALPVVAPSINFAGTADGPALDAALQRMGDGAYDWLSVTSATTVDVLSAHRAVIPDHTMVAAVGETTAAALLAAGYRVDFVPRHDNSAAGLLAEWSDATQGVVPLRILALRSDIAKPVLTDGLRRAGHDVDAVVAYRTVGVPMAPDVVERVAAGRFDAILVTSGSVAHQIAMQIGLVPFRTVLACIGPRTAADAEAAGLRVDLVARSRTSESMIDTLEELALHRPMQGPLP